jgi:3-dehydroquinate synthase
MASIEVNTAGGAYQVRLERGILDAVGELAGQKLPEVRRCLVISDTNVWPLYGARVLESLRGAGLEADEAIMPAGEGSKRLETVEKLCESALDFGLDRSSAVVALGGGVVGDIAGLVAALYMRGIPHVQLPTTLLAMVDSSVGGKTAVDLAGGKNIVGAFHQPSLVLADPEALNTLAGREVAAGAAEIVKAGVLGDAELFELMERSPEDVLARGGESLMTAIRRSVELKRDVVQEDEREQGRRELLNLGHTFGHALETYHHYQELLHGEAVSIGMVLAARLASRVAGFGAEDLARIERVLVALELPVTMGDVDRGAVLELMYRDKKVRCGRLRLVLPVSLGRAQVFEDIDKEEVLACLNDSP